MEGKGRGGGVLEEVVVKVKDLDEKHPQLGTDESYNLQVPLLGLLRLLEVF